MTAFQKQSVFCTELASCLQSYFNLDTGDERKLLADLLICLEAQAMLMQQYAATPHDPNFTYALDSIATVALRLKSEHLIDEAAILRTSVDASCEDRENAVRSFLKLIQSLRSWNKH